MTQPGQSRQGKGRATIEHVAREAKVSRQTISNAINAPHRLNPQTLVRVRQVIDELGYRPNQAARNLRTQRSRLLGFRIRPVLDGINGALLDRFLHELCESAQRASYNVLLVTSSSDEAEIEAYDDLLTRTAVDAFALSDTHPADRRVEWLLDHHATFVTFGRPWEDLERPHSWVDVDGAVGTEAAVDHLVESGYRRIGFVGWPDGSGVGDDRRAGWRRAVERHGLDSTRLCGRVEDSVRSGQECTVDLLGAAEPPDALVCASDSLALGALRAAAEAGRRPGVDFGIVGFDDTTVAAAASPGLTSVHQPVEQVASTVIDILTDHLSGHRTTPSTVLIAPTLSVRATSSRSSLEKIVP